MTGAHLRRSLTPCAPCRFLRAAQTRAARSARQKGATSDPSEPTRDPEVAAGTGRTQAA